MGSKLGFCLANQRKIQHIPIWYMHGTYIYSKTASRFLVELILAFSIIKCPTRSKCEIAVRACVNKMPTKHTVFSLSTITVKGHLNDANLRRTSELYYFKICILEIIKYYNLQYSFNFDFPFRLNFFFYKIFYFELLI